MTSIFRSLQNCQFHHRRLESLEHFNVLYIYIYLILSTTVSHFWTLRMHFFYKVSLFVYISIFASTQYEYLYIGNIYDMAMKRKFIPGNRNYGFCRLHFGYQIIIYIYIYNINDRNFEINVD